PRATRVTAQEVVARYYQSQRSADNRSAARTTVRLLESLIRLAQAHARLMCRTEVTLQDAVVSVICVETSLHSTGRLGVDSVLHSDFPPNPDEEFELHQGLILDRLKLRNPPPPPMNARSGPGSSSPFRSSQHQRGSQGDNYDDTANGRSPLTAEAAAGAAAAEATAAAAARRNEWAARKAAAGGGARRHASDGRSPNGTGTASRSALPGAAPRDLSQDAMHDPSQHRPPRRKNPGGGRSGVGAPTDSISESRSDGTRDGAPGQSAGTGVSAPSSAGYDGFMPDDTPRRKGESPSGEREFDGRGGGGAGPDDEGGRWAGFSGATPPASAGKRRRQTRPDVEDFGGAGGGAGSGWGDVLLMSQRSLSSPPRR
ncbi:unnamed protein product, partial [Hapterophycus canaliculatus]